jgi:uncharacterized protein
MKSLLVNKVSFMKRFSIIIILFHLLFSFSFSQIPEKPNPPRLLNDYVGLLNDNDKNTLEKKLVDFEKETSTQIVIVIVDELGAYDKAQFTYELGEKWGVGQKGFNNGVVIMLKPHGMQGQRHTFIASGYGLEPVLTDAVCKRIVEMEMIPEFRENRFYEGLNKAVDVIMGLATKEFPAEEYMQKTENEPVWPVLITIIIFVVLAIISRFMRVRKYSSINSIPFWTAFLLMSSTGRHSGSYGSFSSGSGGFSGFGGFGGGSFGGGGAGGSW